MQLLLILVVVVLVLSSSFIFDTPVAGRRSRQVFEPAAGVWSTWGEWSECSQTCGVGISQRSRKCYLPGGVGDPAVSPVRPYYPPRYPGQHHLPYRSTSVSTNQNPGLPLYRDTPAEGGGGPPIPAQTNRSPPLYQPEFSSNNQDPVIRPGQFGYGRVPFSLPLHRQNRQARHTVNESNRGEEEEAERGERDRQEEENAEREISETPAAEKVPTVPTIRPLLRPSHTHTQHGRARGQVPPSRPLSRSSLPSVFSSRQRFDWSSVTAPPPPVPPLSRPYSPAAGSPFSPPLHRSSPVHRDRELHPAFSPQAPPAGSIYPLQHPHVSHLGMESGREGGAPRTYTCAGPEKEYRRCFSQVCRGGALDSRAEQCAAFNTNEFIGRLYNWEPFTEVGADKQCELTCRPAGYRFYVRQSERVRDGTPCFNVSTNDVCVEGQCLTEGCDGVLGSGSVIDKCGVCGGRETSCRKVTGSFHNTTVPLGYHKILDIPPGATFINITERRASPNYLAMRSGTGASVVNGRWAVDPPGEYQAGGTTFTYTRPRAQAEGEEAKGESLWAPGPTKTQLQLYVSSERTHGPALQNYDLLRETCILEDPVPAPPPNSVHSYPSSSSSSSSVFSLPTSNQWTPERSRPRGSAPNRNARIPPRTDLPLDTLPPFVWKRSGLTECSASCGKGTQNRLIVCVSRDTDEEVSESKCDSAAKPVPEEEPCNTHPCPPFWEASSWSECSVSCGPGVQQRQLQCRQSFGDRSTMVHPQRCADLTQPVLTQPCQLRLCSHWEVSSNWSQCSVDCGVGKRTRSVRCVSDQGDVVNEKECSSRARPQGSEECNMGPCVTNWYFTDWLKTCSAQCGPGVQKREVVCLTRGGVREGGEGGDCVGDKPAEMKACNGGPCVPVAMWYSSPWTQCNVPCGDGTQRRDIICVQKMGNDFTVVPDAECAKLDKPASVQQCKMGACQAQWFTTEWSACSKSCGKGLQMREVRCLTPEKKHSHECDSSTKPVQEQICNTIPCSPQVSDENCRDVRQQCELVVQARLCVYTYYKKVCCASCVQSAQRAKRH
uniref:PLAC domain-containing protein n=1 Tax=Astatotilapia calliptera TaxID=8154 RepID=A0AAX7V4W1_ASTCA